MVWIRLYRIPYLEFVFCCAINQANWSRKFLWHLIAIHLNGWIQGMNEQLRSHIHHIYRMQAQVFSLQLWHYLIYIVGMILCRKKGKANCHNFSYFQTTFVLLLGILTIIYHNLGIIIILYFYAIIFPFQDGWLVCYR